MAKKKTLQGDQVPPLTQLSRKQLMEMARPYAHRALLKTVELMENADNDSVRLGAAKVILSKVLPDLKATELSTDDKAKFIFQIIKDTTLEDANSKDTTTDS